MSTRTLQLQRPLLAAQRAAGPAGAQAPTVRGVAPRGATIVAECVVVGAARRLAGVVLADARGADDGEPPQHVARINSYVAFAIATPVACSVNARCEADAHVLAGCSNRCISQIILTE